MQIEDHLSYEISQDAKTFFNSAEVLTIVRNDGITVQFQLEKNKGRGSMPVEHLQYLLKKSKLTQIPSKRMMLASDDTEEQIG